MINVDTYYIACCLKSAQIFAISMKNIQYQAKKEFRAEINSKNVIPKKYHNFLNVFSKKYLDTFLLHQKYDHKQKPDYALLYKMFHQKLDTIK